MGKEDYGLKKVMFRVRAKSDNRIRIQVCHGNSSERKVVQRHKADPRFFVEHHLTYSRSKIRAKFWMAQIVSDYRAHFVDNRVDFVFA